MFAAPEQLSPDDATLPPISSRPPRLDLRRTEVLDVHVLELLRIVALLGDVLLAEAALLVDLAVSPERLVGVGANL